MIGFQVLLHEEGFKDFYTYPGVMFQNITRSVSRSQAWVPLKWDSFPLSWLVSQVLFHEEGLIESWFSGVQFRVILGGGGRVSLNSPMLVYLCQCSSGLPAWLACALSGEHQSSPSLPSYTEYMDQGELLFPIEMDQGEDREVSTHGWAASWTRRNISSKLTREQDDKGIGHREQDYWQTLTILFLTSPRCRYARFQICNMSIQMIAEAY